MGAASATAVVAAAPALAAWAGAANATSSVTVAPAPSREHGGGPGRDIAVGLAVEHRLAGELLGAERDQVALVTEALARRRHGLDQFAIGGEDRRRPLEVREQPLRAVR